MLAFAAILSCRRLLYNNTSTNNLSSMFVSVMYISNELKNQKTDRYFPVLPTATPKWLGFRLEMYIFILFLYSITVFPGKPTATISDKR